MRDAEKFAGRDAGPVAKSAAKQERSRTTRRELVAAARDIFARDGFELARLEDIAKAAGKTRGAFYAHFRDKEDVFFAIFEEDLAQDERRIVRALSAARSQRERVEALTRLLGRLVRNRRRTLLSIEFKLYAIRRPHRQRRLAELHAAMCLRCAAAHIDELLPELQHQNPAKKREQAARFAALIDGLVLNRYFDPPALREREVHSLIEAGVKQAFAQTRGVGRGKPGLLPG